MKKLFLFFVIFLNYYNANSFDINNFLDTNTTLIDDAGVLNDEEEISIKNKIQQIRDKYSVEILTIIVKTTDGGDLAQITTEIGQKVGVGKADKDNGIVIFISIDEKKWHIATGYGIEGVLPDLLVNKIGIKNFIKFRDLKYSEGILETLNDFEKKMNGEDELISKMQTPDDLYIFALVIIIYVVGLIGKTKKGRQARDKNRFFGFLALLYIISLPIAYFKDFFIEQSSVMILLTFLGIAYFNKSSALKNGGGWGGGGSGGGGGGFGGGGFGGGGSGGRW